MTPTAKSWIDWRNTRYNPAAKNHHMRRVGGFVTGGTVGSLTVRWFAIHGLFFIRGAVSRI